MGSGWALAENKQFFPLLRRKITCLFRNEFASIRYKRGREILYFFVQNVIRSVYPTRDPPQAWELPGKALRANRPA